MKCKYYSVTVAGGESCSNPKRDRNDLGTSNCCPKRTTNSCEPIPPKPRKKMVRRMRIWVKISDYGSILGFSQIKSVIFAVSVVFLLGLAYL